MKTGISYRVLREQVIRRRTTIWKIDGEPGYDLSEDYRSLIISTHGSLDKYKEKLLQEISQFQDALKKLK